MRKLILFFVWTLCCFAARAQQPVVDNGKGVLWKFETRNAFASSRGGIKMQSVEPEIALGYRFDPRFSLVVPFTATVGLFKSGHTKSYEEAMQLGLGFSYSPLHTDHDRLGIGIRAGSTLGGDWKYLYYDFGVRWQSDVVWAPLYVGAGVRFYDCYGGGFNDYCNFYIAVGVNILRKCNSNR